MIPVSLENEPPDFDVTVRQPGLKWLTEKGLDPNSPPPSSVELRPYWRHSLKHLWNAYSGICAYLAIFFEWSTGAGTTDHFVPKSKDAGKAYEWNNFRLSCLGPNQKKWKFNDILDPFELQEKTFFINFSCGRIYPNPRLSPIKRVLAEQTINRLKLDSPENNEMRARHYRDYETGDCSPDYLKRHSPFVYLEILRQGL